jgi:integrase
MATVTRISEFLAGLDNLTLFQHSGVQLSKTQIEINRKAINRFVKKELDYLRRNLALTSLRRARSDYRNAIREHYKGKNLAVVYTDKDMNNEKVHIAVKYFVLKKVEINAYNQNEAVRTNNFLSGNRIIISNVKSYLNTAISLLNSDNYYQLFAGLLAVTGRRPVEIAKLGSFEFINNNSLLFKGQAKTRGKNSNSLDGYQIPTLCDAKLIISALHKLRELKDLSNNSEREINSLISNQLGKTIKKHFNGFLKVSPNQSLDCLNDYPFIEAKSLRPIATHIAQARFAPLSDLHHFAKNYLGHQLDNTAKNYMEFMLHPHEKI